MDRSERMSISFNEKSSSRIRSNNEDNVKKETGGNSRNTKGTDVILNKPICSENESFIKSELSYGNDVIFDDISLKNSQLTDFDVIETEERKVSTLQSLRKFFSFFTYHVTWVNILLLICCGYFYFSSTAFYEKNEIPSDFIQNIGNIETMENIKTSKLFCYGLFHKHVKPVENMLNETSDCASFDFKAQNGYFQISFNEPRYIHSIAIFHGSHGNIKSAIKDFQVVCINSAIEGKNKKILKFRYENNGFQRFKIDDTADALVLAVSSNYGEKYFSIYRLYIYGH